MTRVTAARLRLRAPEGWTARTQARTEEALRLAAPDGGRLLVMRRLDLGLMPVNAQSADWSKRAGDRMAALASRAVHAASPGAHAAESVWFWSEAEARTLLLAELAAGRMPFAWFWKLAVSEWRGETLADYLPRLIAEAERDPQRLVELARAVTRIAEAGHLPALVAALGDMTVAPIAASRLVPPAADSAPSEAASAHTALPLVLPPSVRLFESLPIAARLALLRAWSALSPDGPVAGFLARMALLPLVPELAARPGLLGEQAHALVQYESSPAGDRPPPFAAPPWAPIRPGDRRADPASVPGPLRRDHATATDFAMSTEPAQVGPLPLEEPLPPWVEQGSAAAGLWLLIRPLALMGLGAWLDARPDLAASGFARALLRHIAWRMRVPSGDPLFAVLGEPVATNDPALLAAWRIGLDRWLRRRVRRKLASVVKRRGWLAPHETGVDVRFRVEQADIALRASALDVDPGWVPWLGMSVAYHYRDEGSR